jgi:hypothetical protein
VLSSELLGYSPEARVLIINADDFGMYPSVNNAVIQSLENGIASSCSLMPPCPGARQALQLLQERPHIPFGVHLTLVCDFDMNPWPPLAGVEKVPPCSMAPAAACSHPRPKRNSSRGRG